MASCCPRTPKPLLNLTVRLRACVWPALNRWGRWPPADHGSRHRRARRCRDPWSAGGRRPHRLSAGQARRRTVRRGGERPGTARSHGQCRCSSDLQQLLPNGINHSFHPGMQLQLLQDVADVVLDSVLADEQRLGDVPIVQPFGDQLEHVHFPIGEPGRRHLLSLAGAFDHRGELGQQLGGHGGRDQRLATAHGADGHGHLVDRDLLEQVAHCTGLDSVVQVGFLVTDRQHDDPGARDGVFDRHTGVDATASRHPDVHQHDVGQGVGGLAYLLGAVTGLADDLEVRLLPDIVLMDVRMPRRGGIDACMAIKDAVPSARIIMLTISDEEADLYDAIKAGAMGYLLKEISIDEVAVAIRAVRSGQSLISPAMASKLLTEFAAMIKRTGERQQVPSPRLTDREMDVLKLVAKGLNNRDIAKALFISENTVKNHIRNILEKLQLHSRMEAVVYAVREKLLEIT